MTPCPACESTIPHRHCVSCGCSLPGDTGPALCEHHAHAAEDVWAAANRAMCDLVHRAVASPRLLEAERAPAPGADADWCY